MYETVGDHTARMQRTSELTLIFVVVQYWEFQKSLLISVPAGISVAAMLEKEVLGHF
jgi:hypothetical protein